MAVVDRRPNLLHGRISGDFLEDRDDLSVPLHQDLLVRLQWPEEVIPGGSRGVVAGPFREGFVEAALATAGLSADFTEAASGAIDRDFSGRFNRRISVNEMITVNWEIKGGAPSSKYF